MCRKQSQDLLGRERWTACVNRNRPNHECWQQMEAVKWIWQQR